MRAKLLLLAIVTVGILLRLHNISPFKIYPDAYQNLLVAHNITTYHSVLGFLGPQGMLYPDFFMWTRPVYALLINFLTFFTNDMTLAAQTVAFLAGTLAIPLAYFFIKSIFLAHDTRLPLEAQRAKWGSLAGAALLALSFNHTIWSGFIMTETTGVLFMLLLLISLFKSLKTKPAFVSDFVTGLLFGLAVLARYEYAIVILPIILLFFRQSPQPVLRLMTIVSGLLLTLSLTAVTLFPLQSVWSIISVQLKDIFILLALVIGSFVLTAVIFKNIPKQYKKMLTKHLTQIVGAVVCLGLLLLLIFSGGGRKFVIHDLLLSIFSVIGILLMLRKKNLHDYAFFSVISLVALGVFYYQINPEMERYATHLIPFLLIPASYALAKTISFSRGTRGTRATFLMVVPVLLVVLQTVISFHGLRGEQTNSWFRTSYEEKAAKMVGKYINSLDKNCHAEFILSSWSPTQWDDRISSRKDSIASLQNDKSCNYFLLVSMPEPYYYNLQTTTHSVADTSPFVFIDAGTNEQKIIIVEDMGMHTFFPTFTRFLQSDLKEFAKHRFFVHETFHIRNFTQKEQYPVVIYELTLGELREKISRSSF